MRDWRFLYYPSDVLLQLRGLSASAPRVLLMVGGTSLLVQMMPIPCFLVLASGLDIPLSAVGCAVLVPLIMLMSMLPVSIAGWGMREGAAIVLFGQVGINAADAVLLSVLFGLISLSDRGFRRPGMARQSPPTRRPEVRRSPA